MRTEFFIYEYSNSRRRRIYSTLNMNSENNKGKSQAVEQANSKDALVQKLEGAMRKLRHDRDKEYRELMEAEGRLRLAREEETALEKIIADLKSKHSNLASQKQELQASLGPLEAQVQDMTEKVRCLPTFLSMG